MNDGDGWMDAGDGWMMGVGGCTIDPAIADRSEGWGDIYIYIIFHISIFIMKKYSFDMKNAFFIYDANILGMQNTFLIVLWIINNYTNTLRVYCGNPFIGSVFVSVFVVVFEHA